MLTIEEKEGKNVIDTNAENTADDCIGFFIGDMVDRFFPNFKINKTWNVDIITRGDQICILVVTLAYLLCYLGNNTFFEYLEHV